MHIGNENGDEQKREWCDHPYPLFRNLHKRDELSIWPDLVVEVLRAFQHLRRSDTSQTVHINPFSRSETGPPRRWGWLAGAQILSR